LHILENGFQCLEVAMNVPKNSKSHLLGFVTVLEDLY